MANGIRERVSGAGGGFGGGRDHSGRRLQRGVTVEPVQLDQDLSHCAPAHASTLTGGVGNWNPNKIVFSDLGPANSSSLGGGTFGTWEIALRDSVADLDTHRNAPIGDQLACYAFRPHPKFTR